ncbi:MAG: hypothetical protein IJ710_00320 [Prevotella sp.]|nr:hypothetical protein [Prevotella sp.]
MNQSELQAQWRNAAGMVFWAVLAIAVLGVVNYILAATSFVENIANLKSSLMDESKPTSVSGVLLMVGRIGNVAAWVCYLIGLGKFARIQQRDASQFYAGKVRSAVILLVVNAGLAFLFSFVSFIPLLSIPLALIVWVIDLWAYFKLKNGATGLMMAKDWTPRARQGARNLKFAALCVIRLMLLPPVLLLLFIVFLFSSGAAILSSPESFLSMFSDMDSLARGGSALLMVVGLLVIVIIILAICWTIVGFLWPIFGWYKIKEGNPCLPQAPSADAPQESVYAVEPQRVEPAWSQRSDDDLPEYKPTPSRPAQTADNAGYLPSDQPSDRRKWYYIGGGIAGVAVLGILLYALFGGSKKELLVTEDPGFLKFVQVVSENAPLYQDASTESPQLYYDVEDLESDMAVIQFRFNDKPLPSGFNTSPCFVAQNEVLPVLEEKGEWYKIQLSDYNAGTVEAYIRKGFCMDVTPEPITQAVLDSIDKIAYTRTYIIPSGKLENLVFRYELNEMDGPSFDVGVLKDGVLYVPEGQYVGINDSDISGVSISKDGNNTTVNYGSDGRYYPNGDPEGGIVFFDVSRLNEEQHQTLLDAMRNEHPQFERLFYYFPTADKQRLFEFRHTMKNVAPVAVEEAAVEEPEQGASDYVLQGKSDTDQQLMAKVNGELISTGICEKDVRYTIDDEHDYDGDGSNEVLVTEWYGGNSNSQYFIVWYDMDSGTFKRTEALEDDAELKPEEQDGKWSFVQRHGIQWNRYVFEDGKLKQTEDASHDVGKPVKTFSKADLYEGHEGENRLVTIDLDDDGNDETITFHSEDIRLYRFGDDMEIESISWGNGRQTTSIGGGDTIGEVFAFLNKKSNGVNDLLVDNRWYYRWDGERYHLWIWDGKNLVKNE